MINTPKIASSVVLKSKGIPVVGWFVVEVGLFWVGPGVAVFATGIGVRVTMGKRVETGALKFGVN